MGLHTHVDRSVATMLGAKVVTTKWVDTSKGDDHNPDYIVRFVAIPQLGSLRVILAIGASNQHRDGPYRILSSDMKGHSPL